MAKVILGTTMSVDGFINDRNGSVAAGEKDVTVIGAVSTAQQCLRASLADELHIDIMPVLLGAGLRLFDNSGKPEIQLERLSEIELPVGRTHLRFRIVK